MMDQSGGRSPHDDGLAQSFERQFAVQTVADSPADDATGKQIDDDRQI